MIELKELPPMIKKRARWARQEIIKSPEKAVIDHVELLAWVYHEGDNLWYSICGDWSEISPEEERKAYEEKQKQRDIELEQWHEEHERWNRIRKGILERDNNTCQLCGKQAKSRLCIHHILKKKEGGTDHADNLITVCPSCHPKTDRKLYNPEWEQVDREDNIRIIEL